MRGIRSLVVLVLAAGVACGDLTPGAPRTVLTVLMANDWAGVAPVVDAVRGFEAAHPGVRVDIEGIYFEFMAETVRSSVARGNPPDVVQWHAFAAGAQGTAEPLDDLWRVRGLGDDEFLPGAIEDVTWAGVKYGVPLDTNAMLLIYNGELLAAAGVRQPGETLTFEGLQAMAEALTSADGARRAIALPSSTWHTYGWIRANGGEVVEVGPGGKPSFTLNRRENVEAMGFLASLVRRKLAFPPTGLPGDRTDAFALFRSGSAAMHASGSWDVAALAREHAPVPYGVAVMPKGAGGSTGTAMGGSSFFVPRGSRRRELAFDFMLRVIDDRRALRLAQEEGRLPARLGVYDEPYFQNDVMRTFLTQLRTAHPFRLESFPEANKAFHSALDDILEGRREAAAALRDAQLRAIASQSSRG